MEILYYLKDWKLYTHTWLLVVHIKSPQRPHNRHLRKKFRNNLTKSEKSNNNTREKDKSQVKKRKPLRMRRIFTSGKVEWMLGTFNSFQVLGPGQIYLGTKRFLFYWFFFSNCSLNYSN